MNKLLLTTCQSGWSNLCCPIGCLVGGTTVSPLHSSKSWWESTWLEPDLWAKMIRNETFYGGEKKKKKSNLDHTNWI